VGERLPHYYRRSGGNVVKTEKDYGSSSRAREASTHADCAEIAAIAGENPVDLTARGDSSHNPIDKPQTERFELSIQLHGPGTPPRVE
jgi:hypothetical protein